MSSCRSCRAPVEWVATHRGKAMPLDLDTVDDGNIIVDTTLTGELVARYVEPGQGDRRSHFATCPHAQSWRRKEHAR